MAVKKPAVKHYGTWLDLSGDKLTWADIIEEVLLARKIIRNYETLLHRYKVPVKDCANAAFQAKKEIYGWQKVENKPVIVKKAKVKKKKVVKK